MRKFTRLFLRLFFAVTFLILFYLSKKTFEIKDSLNDHMALSIDKTNKDNLRLNNKNDYKANDQNKPKIGEAQFIKPEQNVIIKPDEGLHGSKNGLNDVMKKDDQHDKKNTQSKQLKLPPFVSDSPADGPGEHGKPVILHLNSEDEKESKRLYGLNDFNQYVSDRISVRRRLDDARIQGCKDMTYPQNLPMASVILCFHNEAWSVLLRSVHSILDRSPPELLREIIIVDDFSTMDHLKGPLDQYMDGLKKVKIIRASKREGLIRGRLLGYDVASGPVLVFLDSHTECFPGWLEPLVARIAEDPKAVVFPQIPIISKDTFSISNMNSNSVGVFKWAGLTFTWGEMSLKEKKRRKKDTDLIRSPTMPGGLFAIDKQWFTTLGTYDQQLDYWGGENIELSFKSWMCNGSIEVIPCSQVGHVYRAHNPIEWPVSGASARNSIRVAEVWMDEYKEIFLDFSFPKFIRSESGAQCLDSMGAKNIPELYSCHGTGMNQRWVFTQKNVIMQGLRKIFCYERETLRINGCSNPNNIWWLNYEKGTVQHSGSGLCLEFRIPKTLTMAKCNDSKNQRWILPERK